MKNNMFSNEWYHRRLEAESDAPILAGLMLTMREPLEESPKQAIRSEELDLAFGKFVNLMRRQRRLSLEQLAEKVDIDIEELLEIEDCCKKKPSVRTVHNLASFFEIPNNSLLQMAQIVTQRSPNLMSEAIRFAARSESITELKKEERLALETFVSFLSKQ